MALETASPKELGIDASRLARVEEAIERDIDKEVYDGAALAVGRQGRLALFSVQGYAHRETGRRLKEDDVFVSFSSGKQFTVAAVLAFVERGLLQLHQPVADLIPELRKGLMAQEPSGAGRHRQEWERAIAALDATDAITLPHRRGEKKP